MVEKDCYTGCRFSGIVEIQIGGHVCNCTWYFCCTWQLSFFQLLIRAFSGLVVLEKRTIDNFISGSLTLGAEHSPLLFLLEPETLLEGHSSALCPFPPQFQKVVFTTSPESWIFECEFQENHLPPSQYTSIQQCTRYLQDHAFHFQYEHYLS